MSQTQHTSQAERAARERRETPRVRTLGRVHGHVLTVDAPVSVRELGLGGFSVQGSRTFNVDDVHDVRVWMKDGDPVILRGRVVYSRPETNARGGAYVTGFAFDHEIGDVPDAVASLLDALTASLSFDVA